MSGDSKAWALAAGAFGAGVLVGGAFCGGVVVGVQLMKKERKEKKDICNGHSDGYANGNPQEHANGHSNGYANGHSNGEANGAIAITSITEKRNSMIVTNEQVLKEDLAMAHRLVVAFGMDELQLNHISAKLPGWAEDDFWCTPGNLMWADIHPGDLVKKSANITTNILHAACYQACPDALAVCHVHSPAIEAVSCLKEGLMVLSQGGAAFTDRVAYHDWQGISDDDSEAEDIIKAFKTSPKPARVLMMRNHGAITVGNSVAEAFCAMYFLNRACATQLAVMASGGEINYPPDDALQHCAEQFDTKYPLGRSSWPALKKWVKNAERGDGIPYLLRCNLS